MRIQNEPCLRSGRECLCDPRAPCGDCHEAEVSAENLRILREAASAEHGGRAAFLGRCAATISYELSLEQDQHGEDECVR